MSVSQPNPQQSTLPQTRTLSRPYVAFLLASATAVLIVAPGFQESMWPLTWVALVPLLLVLPHVSLARAFLLGWWMETLVTWLAFYWLVNTMVEFGYIPVAVSLLFFALIGLGNGVRLGLFAWWIRLTSSRHSPWWYRLLLPPCTYVALDYLFPRVFPWALGATQLAALPLIQIADVTGIHGITFLLVACSVALTSFFPHAIQPSRLSRGLMSLVFAILLGLSTGYGVWRMQQVKAAMQQAPTLRLALIQPNIGIGEKGRGAKRKILLQQLVEMSRTTFSQQPDLIIWPETMYPYAVRHDAERLYFPPTNESPSTYWLLGALVSKRLGNERQHFNSALLMAPDMRIIGRYDKQQLLAFGEYIPLQRQLPFLRNISPTIGNLTPGTGSLVTLPNGTAFGPLICYEDILPVLGRRAVRQGATFLVNLTNDAWFGQTRAPYQHRLLAAFRAVENRVYLIRATNTGLTSIIDPLGRELAPLPIYQSDTLVQAIQPLRMSTVYTRFGDWFAQLCSAVALLLPCGYWYLRRRETTP